MRSVEYVLPSVSTVVEPTDLRGLTLIFCTFICHYHSSPMFESQVQGLTSTLDRGSLFFTANCVVHCRRDVIAERVAESVARQRQRRRQRHRSAQNISNRRIFSVFMHHQLAESCNAGRSLRRRRSVVFSRSTGSSDLFQWAVGYYRQRRRT